jgi:DNA-binding transcriptional regulator YdaS (Cro superfamily)
MSESLTLGEWLKKTGRKQKYVASLCDVSGVAVHNWVCGKSTPTAHHVAAIEKLTEGQVKAASFAKPGDKNGKTNLE